MSVLCFLGVGLTSSEQILEPLTDGTCFVLVSERNPLLMAEVLLVTGAKVREVDESRTCASKPHFCSRLRHTHEHFLDSTSSIAEGTVVLWHLAPSSVQWVAGLKASRDAQASSPSQKGQAPGVSLPTAAKVLPASSLR